MNQISTFLTLFLLCLTSNSFVNAQTVGFYAPYEDMENECKNSNLYGRVFKIYQFFDTFFASKYKLIHTKSTC